MLISFSLYPILFSSLFPFIFALVHVTFIFIFTFILIFIFIFISFYFMFMFILFVILLLFYFYVISTFYIGLFTFHTYIQFYYNFDNISMSTFILICPYFMLC